MADDEWVGTEAYRRHYRAWWWRWIVSGVKYLAYGVAAFVLLWLIVWVWGL